MPLLLTEKNIHSLPVDAVVNVQPEKFSFCNSAAEVTEELGIFYRASLKLHFEENAESLAVPVISPEIPGFTKEDAFTIAKKNILNFLEDHDLTVYLVITDHRSLGPQKRFQGINDYIRHNYFTFEDANEAAVFEAPSISAAPSAHASFLSMEKAEKRKAGRPKAAGSAAKYSRDTIVDFRPLDESFSEMLLRKIDEKGITDVQCYKKANIDKKLFSKIRSNPQYRPKKGTVLAFCLALEFTLDETEEMLKKAGFALSESILTDVIVKYYIVHNMYDIYEVNEVLFDNDLPLLGSVM